VFRTLELLAELGVLDRVHAGDGCHRYAVCETRHHHHLMCLDCSTVVLVVASEIEEQIRRMASEADFELLTHHLELIGRCAACRRPPES
jgi:Fur family ferric uptake transcriptional regulator